MFIPNTENLVKRKKNLTRSLSGLENLNFKQLKEALEIQGTIIISSNKDSIKIDNIYAISFLTDLYYSFLDDIDKEVNVHYWEDHGHRIDIFKQPNSVKVVDSNTIERSYIELTPQEFKDQFAEILRSISRLSFLVYFPLVERRDYFQKLEEMSTLPLEWPFKPIV